MQYFRPDHNFFLSMRLSQFGEHVPCLVIRQDSCDALVMRLNAILLSPCYPVLLNVDMVIGLKGMNGLVGELNPMGISAIIVDWYKPFGHT